MPPPSFYKEECRYNVTKSNRGCHIMPVMPQCYCYSQIPTQSWLFHATSQTEIACDYLLAFHKLEVKQMNRVAKTFICLA